jgi:glycosyltransferase involved in cell wall biosynthesis
MRVIFNGLPAYSPKTGVGTYVVNLLAQLRGLAGDAAVEPFPTGLSALAAGLGGRLRAWKRPQTGAGGARGGQSLNGRAARLARSTLQRFYARSFRRMCRLGQFDLYHEPNFIPWKSPIPTVITVHDLSVLLHPQWHPRDRVEFHERHFEKNMRRCRHVLTVSEQVRGELIRTLGLPHAKVSAVPNGVGPSFQPMPAPSTASLRARLGLPPDYLLHVGTIEPRKNILMLLKAYCGLDEALRSRCPLVLAGGWGWNFAAVRDYYECEARHRGVVRLGYVVDRDLPALYSAARALVFPSHYEGFGLPPIEMMACGGAVLASTAPAIREVCAPHAHFLDPDDESGWHNAMRRIIRDSEWLSALRCGVVEHASRYSWRRCAEGTWRVYEQLVTDSAALQRAA